MKQEIEIDTHKAVGPATEMYGHGPVAIIQDKEVRDHDTDEGTTLFVCLDCGYAAADDRMLAHEDCDREDNPITKTWREYLSEDEFPGE